MYFVMLQLISIYSNKLNLITVTSFIIRMIIYTDGSGKTGRYCYLFENLGKKTVQIFEKPGITNNAIKEDRLRLLAQEVWNLSSNLSVKFIWIPRQNNKAGKILG